MRTVTDHKLNGLNEALEITATDEPGQGGANHSYTISVDETKTKLPPGVTIHTHIGFQNGPILEAGINGISQEALLAIVIDRLRSFQAGPYACRENAVALTKCQEALMWLQKRTQDRLRRGVEGTNAK
jgi:hypothetical protein